MSRPSGTTIACPLLALALACSPGEPGGSAAPKGGTGAGVVPIDRARLERMDVVAGQTVYVPVYSHVYSSNEPRPFPLAATLSVRNTDPDHTIVVASVRYYDSDGHQVRDYLARPVELAPMASTEFFVSERDVTGGFGANFLVEWVAPEPVSDPLVEAVMIGTARTQGISFVGQGRVVRDRSTGR